MTATSPFAYSKPFFQRLLDWKIRSVRWIDIIGLALAALMLMSVYVAKAGASRESGKISEIEREIRVTDERVRRLRAEAARLEQPARLEALSRNAGLEPVKPSREATLDDLPELKANNTKSVRAPAATAAMDSGGAGH